MTARYIMTTRIINGRAETKIDQAALPCQRIAANVPSVKRHDWISNTAHTEADTLDPIIERQQEIIAAFGLDFAQLVAQHDADLDAARDQYSLP